MIIELVIYLIQIHNLLNQLSNKNITCDKKRLLRIKKYFLKDNFIHRQFSFFRRG